MTYDQTVTLTSVISAAQNVSFADKAKLKVWYNLLEDLEYEAAHLALKKLLRTSEYNITPAHIRNACAELTAPMPDAAAAVSLVYGSINGFGRNGAVEAMKHIEEQDSVAYLIVKSIGYTNMCNGNPEYTRGEFIKLYRDACAAHFTEKALPASLIAQIEDFRGNIARHSLALLEMDE